MDLREIGKIHSLEIWSSSSPNATASAFQITKLLVEIIAPRGHIAFHALQAQIGFAKAVS